MRNNDLINVQVNRMARAICRHVIKQSGSSIVVIPTSAELVRIDISDGRLAELIYGYLIEAIYQTYPSAWEAIALRIIRLSLDGEALTEHGVKIWASMLGDIAATIDQQGANHA